MIAPGRRWRLSPAGVTERVSPRIGRSYEVPAADSPATSLAVSAGLGAEVPAVSGHLLAARARMVADRLHTNWS